jgi:hypothetical protein
MAEGILTTLASKDLQRSVQSLKSLQNKFTHAQASETSSSAAGSTTGSSDGPTWRNPALDSATHQVLQETEKVRGARGLLKEDAAPNGSYSGSSRLNAAPNGSFRSNGAQNGH